jgi:PAS domain S-box-containing protein
VKKRVKPGARKIANLRTGKARSRKRANRRTRRAAPGKETRHDSHDLLRAFVEGATDALFVKDRDGRYLIINATGARFVGQPIGNIIGKDDRALFTPEIARQIMERDRHIMASRATEIFEETVPASGVMRTYLTTKSPYRDEHGRIIGVIGVARDITERKRAEDVVRESELRFRTAVQATNAVVWEWDLKTNGLWWSSNVLELLGSRPDELGPGAEAWSNRLHPEEKDRIVSEVNSAIQKK